MTSRPHYLFEEKHASNASNHKSVRDTYERAHVFRLAGSCLSVIESPVLSRLFEITVDSSGQTRSPAHEIIPLPSVWTFQSVTQRDENFGGPANISTNENAEKPSENTGKEVAAGQYKRLLLANGGMSSIFGPYIPAVGSFVAGR
jgi:hypothetical protein